MADRWFKFYSSTWLSNPGLRSCSPAARSVWLDILCVMDEADPRGHFLVNGIAPSSEQIARLCGVERIVAEGSIAELESAGVIERDADGAICADIDIWIGAGEASRTVGSSQRQRIFTRDGHVCRYCGEDEGPFEIDHMFPFSRGGGDEDENLVVACKKCNRSKGDLTIDEWGGQRV